MTTPHSDFARSWKISHQSSTSMPIPETFTITVNGNTATLTGRNISLDLTCPTGHNRTVQLKTQLRGSTFDFEITLNKHGNGIYGVVVKTDGPVEDESGVWGAEDNPDPIGS